MKKTLKILLFVILAVSMVQASYALQTGFAIDPMYIGVGARPLGMGKAFVAVAEDADTIFMNPAGLGKITSWKLTSTYSNLMGDVKYSVLGGVIPMETGSLGFGYITSRVDDIWIMGSDATSATHKPTPGSLGEYSNSVGFVSYGFPLEKVTGFGKDVYVGANLKYFDQQGSGTDEAYYAGGRGIDVDLGILYSPKGWLSLGITQQNAVPASFGGAVTYRSGVEESIPSITKAGAKIAVLGEEDSALIISPLKLNLAADIDLHGGQNNVPMGAHLGAEFMPNDFLSLRAGVDRDPYPSTVDISQATNFTYGVGLKFAGLRFDYAYHPYSLIAENATHFFSFSFVGEEKKEESKSNEYITLLMPKDKFITRKDYVRIYGIVRPEVEQLEINGAPIPIEVVDGQKAFRIKTPIEGFGKRSFIAEAFDKDGNNLDKKKRRILRVASFADVPDDYWAFESVELGATAGLFEGYPDKLFRPNQVMSRAELTTMMVRVSKPDIKQSIERQVFPDLPYYHWSVRYVEAAKDMGLVIGYPDKNFKADKKIDRAEGVTVGARFDGGYIVDPDEKPYSDVSKKSWAAGYIETAKQKGLLDYISTERFAPKQGLTRAEAAEIISKTDFGTRMIEDLLNWDKGYGLKSMLQVKPE
ncbi:MAG: S-layer homology domain-containing protein [Candidatus Margulisiibacteriota bacterium]